jgi:hypothetical protein
MTREFTPQDEAFIKSYGNSVADASEEDIRYFLQHYDEDHSELEKKLPSGAYTSIMDALCVWNDAIRYARSNPELPKAIRGEPQRLLLIQGDYVAIYEGRKELAMYAGATGLDPATAEQTRTARRKKLEAEKSNESHTA